MTRTTSVVLLTALLAVGTAGCSGGAGPGATPSTSASTDRQQLLALAQDWVKCMRDNGLTRMPDAQLTREGYLSFPPRAGYEWKADLGKYPGILDKCKSYEDKYPPNAFRPRDTVTPDDLRKLTEYAKCIRANGIPDFPDPDAEGVFDLGGRRHPDATRDRAEQACSHIWSKGIKVKNAPGGKK